MAVDNKPRAWPAATRWEQSLNDLLFSIPVHGIVQFRHERWRDVFRESEAVKGLFSVPIGEDHVSWTVWVTEETLRARVGTISIVTMLKGEDRKRWDETFTEILQGEDVERNASGEIAVHGKTHFAWTRAV